LSAGERHEGALVPCGKNLRALINLFATRWEIEGGFRDAKDLRFGIGVGSMHVRTPQRGDRLLLIGALAVVLLTLLGTPGKQFGYNRHLKTNTTKRRAYSLFAQMLASYRCSVLSET
jgi:hypothetical protein